MHIFQTRRLGDSIHAYAVMAAVATQGGDARFLAYAPFARLFSGGRLQVSPHDRGTQWKAASRNAFKGPEHGEHVRDSMARAAGVADGTVPVMLSLPRPPTAGRPYVVVCPDAGASYKECPRSLWAPLIEHVLSQGCGAVICGLPGRRRIPSPAPARHMAMTVLPLASIIAGARAVIGPDSGHIHLADALGVPAVGLYAATSTTTYGPYVDSRWCIDRHRSVFSPHAPYNSARHLIGNVMDAIVLEDVVDVLSRLFQTQSGLGSTCECGDVPFRRSPS